MLRIDHVIYVARDLDAAAERFEREHGLASVSGGRHGGWGTANRIVPLGDDYVEIVAAIEADVATTNPFGRWVLSLAEKGEGLAGWAVATDDIAGVAGRLGLEIAEGSRTKPDGTVLSWRLAGIERMLAEPSHPLFLQWGVPPDLHPGRARVEHRTGAEGIAWVAVAGDDRSLGKWLGGESLPVRVSAGEPSLREAAVRTRAGEIVLR